MPELVDDGWCFACGRLNPEGMHLSFEPTEDGARTTYTVEKRHQGYRGMAHGGIVFTLLDEATAYAIYYRYGLSATAEFQARIRRPCPLEMPLVVEARILRQKHRLVECQAWIAGPDGSVIAESTAKFMLNKGQLAASTDRSRPFTSR